MMVTSQDLVKQYIPLANKLAFQKKRMLPSFIDVEDLQSAAYLGLVEAASRFDPSQNVQFSTFAYPRIFGAIQDYLREQGWFRRRDYKTVLSLDVPCADDDCTLGETVEARSEDTAEECFEAISSQFDHQAKKILRYYFIDDCSMKEVGDRFGVSESRISQLIKQYKTRIRKQWDTPEKFAELAA